MVSRASKEDRERALVMGASGGVGTACVLLAKAAGAKPFVGELGGNSANIVCADADIKDAAKRILTSDA